MAARKLTRGDTAPVITVLDSEGSDVTLDATYWKEGLTFLSFLRHFG